jgi:hypothetical protein
VQIEFRLDAESASRKLAKDSSPDGRAEKSQAIAARNFGSLHIVFEALAHDVAFIFASKLRLRFHSSRMAGARRNFQGKCVRHLLPEKHELFVVLHPHIDIAVLLFCQVELSLWCD